MPQLAMRSATTCVLCRCRLRGVRVGLFRINKNSLRATGTGVLWAEQECVECGHPQPTHDRWSLDAESTATVRLARASKGWS